MRPQELVTVQMVALETVAFLVLRSRPPESRTDKNVNVVVLAANNKIRITTAAFVSSSGRTKNRFAFAPLGVEDVAVRVGEIRFPADEIRRNRSNNMYFHMHRLSEGKTASYVAKPVCS